MATPSLTLESKNGRKLTFQKTTIPPITVTPKYPVYGQVVDLWYDIYGQNVFDYGNYPQSVNSIPCVGQMAQLSNDTAVYVTKQISAWWYKLTQEVCPVNYPHDEIVKTLLNLTQGRKAFTNNTGWDAEGGNRREYWSGEPFTNGQKEDMALQHVWSSGSTYKIIGEINLPGKYKECYRIEAFDAFDPATYTKTYKGNEWMFSIAASNSRANNAAGFISNPFPRLYNRGTPENNYRDFSRVLVPLIANHRREVYMPKFMMRILPEGSLIPAYPYRS